MQGIAPLYLQISLNKHEKNPNDAGLINRSRPNCLDLPHRSDRPRIGGPVAQLVRAERS
jgi:hypothetical protein